MKSLESQYKNLNQNEINIEWNNAAKWNNYSKIKYMFEADYISIPAKNIDISIFRAGSNDNVKMLKYFFKNLNGFTNEQWTQALNGATCSQGVKALDFILKKHEFTQEELSTNLSEVQNNIPAFEMLIEKLNLNNEITKNENSFLKKAVQDSRVNLIELLIKKYQIDFSSFKNYALEKEEQYNGGEVLKLIETQELFNNMTESLTDNSLNKLKDIKPKKI